MLIISWFLNPLWPRLSTGCDLTWVPIHILISIHSMGLDAHLITHAFLFFITLITPFTHAFACQLVHLHLLRIQICSYLDLSIPSLNSGWLSLYPLVRMHCMNTSFISQQTISRFALICGYYLFYYFGVLPLESLAGRIEVLIWVHDGTLTSVFPDLIGKWDSNRVVGSNY